MTERREPGAADPLRILGALPSPPVGEEDALREELERALFFTKADSLIGWAVNQSRANQTQGHGFDKVHHSLTLKNAIAWAHCYDAATVTRHGQFIAATTTRKA